MHGSAPSRPTRSASPVRRPSLAPRALGAGVAAAALLGLVAAPAGAAELDRISPATFGLKLDRTPTKNTALDRLKLRRTTVQEILNEDTNRQATPIGGNPAKGDLRNPAGFLYQDGPAGSPSNDQDSTRWYPQGVTGSGDAVADGLWAGRRVLLSSWHSDEREGADYENRPGVRISISSAEDLDKSRYRHALLAQPVLRGGKPTLKPVQIHAGGIAWYKRWLYVADTSGGLRIFDMTRIRQVDDTGATDATNFGCTTRKRCRAAGYKYVIPQVARYRQTANLAFSAVSLDRSNSTLSVVEYRKPGTEAANPSRVVRWRIDTRTGLLRGATKRGRTARANGAWDAVGVKSAQGVLTRGNRVAISSSNGDSNAGTLWRGTLGGGLSANPWVVGGEDLTYAPGSGRVYTVAEHPGKRGVLGIPF